jgi:YegS/Rv2252/BmrU family lipid kinase
MGLTGRTLIVWNPNSGSKAGLPTNRTSEEELRQALAKAGIVGELFVGDSSEAATSRVRRAVADGYSTIIAAGGDGTIAIVAQEILGRSTSLGILPLGSAMNVARSLSIPRDLEVAAAIVASGVTRKIDVGEVEGKMFLEMASIGASAELFGEAQQIDRGSLLALFRLLFVPFRVRSTKVTLTLDEGTIRTRALMVEVANTPYTGMGFTLAPGARSDDGLLDVRVFRRFSGWGLVRHFGRTIWGRRHYSPNIAAYRSSALLIEAARPLPCRADALDIGTTPCRITVRRAALQVIVPRGDPA